MQTARNNKTVQTTNYVLNANEEHGATEFSPKMRIPLNWKIYDVNSNAPIIGEQSACYDNALFYAKKNNVPLVIGCFIDKNQIIDDKEWVDKTDYNKVNPYFSIYPHAWNLDSKGHIFDITIENDLDEYIYVGIEVDPKKFKTGFGDLSEYLNKLMGRNLQESNIRH